LLLSVYQEADTNMELGCKKYYCKHWLEGRMREMGEVGGSMKKRQGMEDGID
jgi:hypothetical protein